MKQEGIQHRQEDVQRQDEQEVSAKVIDDEATLSNVTGSALGAGNYTLMGVLAGAGAYSGIKLNSRSSS
jgi:hypothetical protein